MQWGRRGGFGTLFEYDLTNGNYAARVQFNNTNGRAPRGKLHIAGNGLLYGVTQLGGANSRGVIFSFNTSNNQYAKLHDFDLTNGGQPTGGVVQAANGNLYGSTQLGGTSSAGVVYEFVIGGASYSVIQNLTNTLGRAPIGPMMLASNGLLYGTTSAGGTANSGVIFTIDPTTNIYTKRKDLLAATGALPYGALYEATNGLLYGMTVTGGAANDGVIYSLNTTNNAYTKLADMDNGGFASPWGGLIQTASGALLGLSSNGGQGSVGALFSFDIGTNGLTHLVSMNSSNGGQPKGRLMLATNGLFYGLTEVGGANAEGVLFSFDPGSDVYTKLADLGGGNGSFPTGSLTQANGKVYGICSAGGTNNAGTIFEFDLGSNIFTKKVDLSSSLGSAPAAGFMLASNGKLYSVASAGGSAGGGTLFEYTVGATNITVLYNFTAVEGTTPLGNLTQASNGKLYGTLSDQGQFLNGAIFEYDLGGTFTILYSMEQITGSVPAGGLVQASNGLLYGIASDGGGFLNGGIFSWDITNSLYDLEYDFTTSDGSGSESTLIEASNGQLYGTAATGGNGDNGTVFRYNKAVFTLQVLKNFQPTTDGQYPFEGLASDQLSSSALSMNIKVFLGGPYDSGAGLMNDALRGLAQFPTTEPFTTLGFTHVGEGGGETINASVLSATGNNAVVDWIMVELRDKNNNANVVNTRSALLQRDGDIVELDGISSLEMGVADDDYFIAIRHRNHLGVLTSNTVALSSGSTPIVDFTDGSTATFGTSAQQLQGSALVNWAGNVFIDSQVKYTGFNNDRDQILQAIGGSVPTATVAGYLNEDVNMNGEVKYTGADNDRDPILVNIGGTTPTNVTNEQLP